MGDESGTEQIEGEAMADGEGDVPAEEAGAIEEAPEIVVGIGEGEEENREIDEGEKRGGIEDETSPNSQRVSLVEETEPEWDFQLDIAAKEETPTKKSKGKEDKKKKVEKKKEEPKKKKEAKKSEVKKKENEAANIEKESKKKEKKGRAKKARKSLDSQRPDDDQASFNTARQSSILRLSSSHRRSMRPSLFFQGSESFKSSLMSLDTLGSYSSASSSYMASNSRSKMRKDRKKKKDFRVSMFSQISKLDIKKGVEKGKKKKEEISVGGSELDRISEEPTKEEIVKEPPPKKPKKHKKAKKGEDSSGSETGRQDDDKKKQDEETEAARLRLAAERKAAVEKEKREIVEQQLRVEQLEETDAYIGELQRAEFETRAAERITKEWDDYLVCDGRPDPENVPEMNTYLHVWENEVQTVKTELAVYRTNEMYNLLQKLQELIDDPFDVTESKQNDWIWIRSRFRALQRDNLSFCTYRLIRNINENLNRIDIPTADFRLKERNFSLCLWAPVQLPIPVPNPRNPSKPRVCLDMPEMSMNVLFPINLDCERLVLRGMYLKYNHLSDTSASFPDPALPEVYSKGLAENTANDWYVKLLYKFNNRLIDHHEDADSVQMGLEGEMAFGPNNLPPVVPYQRLEPTASEHAIAIEDKAIEDARNAMRVTVPENAINLRKYAILGGVYYVDLFLQPTQPQETVSFEIFITTLILPCQIEKAPFRAEYHPTLPLLPAAKRTPEEIEEDFMIREKELEKLIFVTLELPAHVLWLEVPTVCQWNEETKEWSTADVHDFKYSEEKGCVTFRTGTLGAFGIATNKYLNFPFQSWELRPEIDGTVTFQITGAILLIEFHVKNQTVCLTQVQNAPSNAMDKHLNVYYKLPKLIRIMREAGVDIFPAFDTIFYVEGICEKYYPMEVQTYYGMAMTAIAYNFSWSKWNVTTDYRTVVLQARLYKFDKLKQSNFSTCLVTPLKATIIDCTETSRAFSEVPVEGMKFHADFYHLMKGVSNITTKDRLAESDFAVVNVLSKLLIATRFLSFS